jgi:SAM-dependent methyltransferase
MQDLHSEIKAYYEQWWENPRDPRSVIFKELNRIVFERLPRGEGKKALDVGSGRGTIVSFLRRKGYEVTAIELNETFTERLRQEFPEVEVLEGDINSVPINGNFDVVTAIEFSQNLNRETLTEFLSKVATLTGRLVMNISNRNSLHGFWTSFRGFQKPFVHTYSPEEIEGALREIGFVVTHTRGIGLLTPITLLSNFRLRVVPISLVQAMNRLGDPLLPGRCHLYYLEAEKGRR